MVREVLFSTRLESQEEVEYLIHLCYSPIGTPRGFLHTFSSEKKLQHDLQAHDTCSALSRARSKLFCPEGQAFWARCRYEQATQAVKCNAKGVS